MAEATERVNWSSKWTFILAAVGSAVGLGNIWKFPYQAGLNGGGAFVLFYLAFVFLIGLPVLMAELSIGRRAQKSPIPAMQQIAKEEGRSKLWTIVGWSGVLGGFTIITYYSVVGGWVLAYIAKAIAGFDGFDAEMSRAAFGAFSSDPVQPAIWHIAFMAITVAIVARGVKGGLEKAVTILMPALFVLLIGMVIYSGLNGNFIEAVEFLFTPNFEKLLYNEIPGPDGTMISVFTIDRVLNALGLAFFSLSLGMGTIMTYGSYLTKDVNIGRSALTIAAADSAVAVMAGLAIFPIVFAYGLNPGESVGLVFITLPIAFGQMPAGELVGAAFFFLLAFAAITSAISLLEPAVSFIGERTGMSRRKASIMVGSAAAAVGLLSAWAQPGSLLGDVTIFGMDIMSAKGYLTDNLMMPLGGLFIALFAGWFISRKNAMDELAMEDSSFKRYYFLVRYVCPIAILSVFISVLFFG